VALTFGYRCTGHLADDHHFAVAVCVHARRGLKLWLLWLLWLLLVLLRGRRNLL